MNIYLTSGMKNLEIIVTEVQGPETGEEDRLLTVPGERLDVVITQVQLHHLGQVGQLLHTEISHISQVSTTRLGNFETKTFEFPHRHVIYHWKALEISFQKRYDSKFLVEGFRK